MVKSVCNFSGGKDSTAMLFGLKDKGIIPDYIIFADTKKEFEEMYEFLDSIEDQIGRKIIKTEPVHTWKEWFHGVWGKRAKPQYQGKQRGFPMITAPACWHMRNAKAMPLDRWREKNVGKDTIIYVGLNADEAERRMDIDHYVVRKKKEIFVKGDPRFKYPLIEWGWGTKDVIAYCKKINRLNPLYSMFTRLGCWPCPYQSQRSLYSLWKFFPIKWQELKRMEKESPHGFKIDKTLDEYEILFRTVDPATLQDVSTCSLNGDCRPLFGIEPLTKKVCGGRIELKG